MGRFTITATIALAPFRTRSMVRVCSRRLPSSDLKRYGERGRGRWITIYSRPGHTFAVIAGLRFDTTDLGRGGDVGPRWYADGRYARGYVARHPAGF